MPKSALAMLLLVGTIVIGGQARAASPAEFSEPAGAQAIALNSVQALDYSVSAGAEILIRLVFRDELAQPPAVLATHHPAASISFDFAATSSAIGRKVQQVNQRGLRSIQLIPSRDRARLVVNLNRPHVYETEMKGKELLIILRPPELLTGAHVGGEPRHSLRDVSFEPGAGRAGKIIVELSDPAIPVDVRQQGRTLIVDFLGAALPPHLARQLDVSDFGTPVRTIETRRAGNAARMIVEIDGAVEYSAHQTSGHFVFESRSGIR